MSVVLNHPSIPQASAMVHACDSLSFARPVTRELVHRSSVAEVFVTDGARAGDREFVVAAQWPRDHALYHPDENGLSDPLLFAETLRQGMVYVAHRHCGVPLGRRFIGRDIDFEITDPAALRVEGVPLSVFLVGEWTWDGDDARGRSGARMDFRLVVGGRACGWGTISMLMVDERRYRLLRRLGGGASDAPATLPARTAASGAPRTPPHRVGRLRWRDCVLEEAARTDEWRLRVDRDHAVLFDHPTDHIPMMVMLEGFRQLGHLKVHEACDGPFADLSFALARTTVQCLAFGEFDRPTRLVVDECASGARPQETFQLSVSAVQGDTVLARARTAWACVGTRPAAAVPASW